jgi:hypothetical protein
MNYFQESVAQCFDSALVSMGGPIRDWVYDFIEKKGIPRGEIPARFEDVIHTLLERLGNSARVIAYRTMVQLYQQFSLNPDFAYQDSLIDKYNLLKDRVVTDRLTPKLVRNPF